MTFTKQKSGFLIGIIIFVLVLLLPLDGLSREGQICLGLTLMTVVWWAAQVAQSGYVGGFYLVSVCLLKLADTKVVFAGWTTSTLWLVIGAYMIAAAVKVRIRGTDLLCLYPEIRKIMEEHYYRHFCTDFYFILIYSSPLAPGILNYVGYVRSD